jgi:hypothetical protein
MTRRIEGAELLDRLCELRDAYQRRGPRDRAASITVQSLVEDLANMWDHAHVVSEPSA